MRRLCAVVGALLILSGAAVALWQHAVNASYARLAREVVCDSSVSEGHIPSSGSEGAGIDWDELRLQNARIAAWVDVEGTNISLPVVEAPSEDGEYYLYHDFWNRTALEGTPFLDHRCRADDPHRLVYGHHLASGGQFSELQHAYEQESFDGIGACRWYTPDEGETKLQPLCALRVDMRYETIQRFGPFDQEELHEWLHELVGQASACSSDAPSLASRGISALTLVTCSSDLARQPWRTLVIFVEVP